MRCARSRRPDSEQSPGTYTYSIGCEAGYAYFTASANVQRLPREREAAVRAAAVRAVAAATPEVARAAAAAAEAPRVLEHDDPDRRNAFRRGSLERAHPARTVGAH